MKRIILDTNIYGRIVEKREEDVILLSAQRRKNVIIYGFDVVRKELRATSRFVTIGKTRLRLALLGMYDKLAENHSLSITLLIKNLAEDYYTTYARIGGKEKRDEIINDFLIVACASIHDLDIVVSEDRRTMMSDHALTSYDIVNGLKKYRLPKFIDYNDFRRLLT